MSPSVGIGDKMAFCLVDFAKNGGFCKTFASKKTMGRHFRMQFGKQRKKQNDIVNFILTIMNFA